MSWWKPKWVHLDVICIIHTVVLFFFLLSKYSIFWNWVGFEKKKDIHRLSNFYNWLFICILYQWSFLYWKLKKKNLYWKKNCLASQCGLALTRSWVWPLGGVKQFFFVFFFWLVCFLSLKKDAWILILLRSLHVPHFVNQFQFRGGWDPLNRGKFHVSICAVHIV